jgi:hypothetical protein
MIKMVSITSAIDREIIESVPSDCGGRYGYIDFIVGIDHGCGAGSGIGGAT